MQPKRILHFTHEKLEEKPTATLVGELNTNVYGVFGHSQDGHDYPIEHFRHVRLTNDQRLESYKWEHAEQDAKDVAKRNGIHYAGRIPVAGR